MALCGRATSDAGALALDNVRVSEQYLQELKRICLL
jgi:hypothetical protein